MSSLFQTPPRRFSDSGEEVEHGVVGALVPESAEDGSRGEEEAMGTGDVDDALSPPSLSLLSSSVVVEHGDAVPGLGDDFPRSDAALNTSLSL